MPRDDRILPLTRALLIPLAILSAIFGPLLFLFPTRTDTLFAWTITPPMSAVFVGASYTFGALTIGHLLVRGQWHPMRVALTGTWAFGAAMLAATLLHLDRFHLGTVQFYIWLVVYILTPVAVPIGYWLNQRRDPGPASTDTQVAQRIRVMMVIVGIPITLLGLTLFFSPTTAAAIWPWRLTPLMSRVIGGWLLLPGVAAVVGYTEPRWTAYRTVFQDTMVWVALLLVGSLLHLADFDYSRPSAPLWFVGLLGGLLLTAGLYRYHDRRDKSRESTPPRKFALP